VPDRIKTFRQPSLPGFVPAVPAARSEDRRESDAFYSDPRWRRLSKSYLREHPLCEDCLPRGRVEASRHSHHKLDRRTHPELAFDRSNLKALCRACHNRHHNRRAHA
jgi:5-methylcytosine-specific restriction protein A